MGSIQKYFQLIFLKKMRGNHFYSKNILIILCFLLFGCSYTQLIRHQVKPPIGNVIDVYPSEYEVEILDSSQIKDEYIVIDSFRVDGDEQKAIAEAWKTDADAIINIRYLQEYFSYEDSPYLGDRITIFGEFIKFIKYIFPCDSPVVTFKFPEPLWVVASVKKYNDSIVLKINDDKIDRIELEAANLSPGFYEIHVVVGENPIWTRRGWYWETSRWIEIQ